MRTVSDPEDTILPSPGATDHGAGPVGPPRQHLGADSPYVAGVLSAAGPVGFPDAGPAGDEHTPDGGDVTARAPSREQLLTIRSADRHDAVIVEVEGDVDGLTAHRLRVALGAAFARLDGRLLIIDLTAVRFLGSPGLRTLFDSAAEAVHHPGHQPLRVVVDNTRPVIRPIEIVGLDAVLALYGTTSDALADDAPVEQLPPAQSTREDQTRPVVPPSDQDGRPARPDAAHTSAATRLGFALGADWSAPSIARDRLRHWFGEHRWPPAQAEELLLAASEAVSNSVQHGYGVTIHELDHPGPVELHTTIVTTDDSYRCAELTIRDHGAWRPPVGGPTRRGHGLLIMRTCADECTIDGTPTGTTVVLRSRPVAPHLSR